MQIGVGDDRIWIVTTPGIDETLEVVTDAQSEPPFGEILPDNVLIKAVVSPIESIYDGR